MRSNHVNREGVWGGNGPNLIVKKQDETCRPLRTRTRCKLLSCLSIFGVIAISPMLGAAANLSADSANPTVRRTLDVPNSKTTNAAASVASGRAQAEPRTPSGTTRIYGNWQVDCDPQGVNPVRCSAKLPITANNGRQLIAFLLVGKSRGGRPLLNVFTPTYVAPSYGVTLKFGDNKKLNAPFSSCDKNQCIASAAYDDELMQKFLKNSSADLSWMGADKQKIRIIINLEGAKFALNSIS